MKVRCTPIVDKEVGAASRDAMDWLASVLEAALVNESFGGGVDQFMVVAVAAYEDPGKDQEFIRFNTLCTLYEDPVTHESVQLLSVALPIGYQQLRAFEPGNLRKFIATTLVETLKKAQ